MKDLIRKILKEETTNRFIDKVANYVKPPYFKNMESLGVSEDEIEIVFSKIFNQPVTIRDNDVYDANGNIIYHENIKGRNYWKKFEYDDQGNEIYSEDSDGFWYKTEYNTNSNIIYYERSDGFWKKYEYDANGNKIYYEDSNGRIYDYR